MLLGLDLNLKSVYNNILPCDLILIFKLFIFVNFEIPKGLIKLLNFCRIINSHFPFRSSDFVLQSPNYPFPYPHNLDCTATVFPVSDNICFLEVRFDEFRVEPSAVFEECANDYLEVDDGPGSRKGSEMRSAGFLVFFNNLIKIYI